MPFGVRSDVLLVGTVKTLESMPWSNERVKGCDASCTT